MSKACPQVQCRQILLVGLSAERTAEFCATAESKGDFWKVEAVPSAVEALHRLEENPVQAVVTQAWLTDSNGVDFLDTVMSRWPETARLVLSDSASLTTTVRGVGKAHHHIFEPFDPGTVFSLFEEIGIFNRRLDNPRVAGLIAKMSDLPSPPEIYFQVLEEARSSEGSVERVGNLIVQDPALSAKVMQLANSAVFGLQLRVVHPVEAVAYLGLEATRALLLLAHTFSHFDKVQAKNFSAVGLQNHMLAVARYAQRIAEAEVPDIPEIQSEAFTAGLLHDLGKLLFAANLPNEFAQVLVEASNSARPLWAVEAEHYGADHAELGGFILETWHLPEPIVDAVTWHHRPSKCRRDAGGFSALTAVHVANALDHEREVNPLPGSCIQPDLEYLTESGLFDRYIVWRQE